MASSTARSPKLSASINVNNSNNNNARSFQKSAFIFAMGCLFGMQIFNFQNYHDGSLLPQESHIMDHHHAPMQKTPATKTIEESTSIKQDKEELKSLIRSELLDILRETKAELSTEVPPTTPKLRRETAASKTVVVEENKDEEEQDETNEEEPNNKEEPDENEDEPEVAPKAAPDDDDNTPQEVDNTPDTRTLPKIPEPLVQPFVYTQEDRQRNLLWKSKPEGRDWRLDDAEEQKVWEQLASEQRTLWSNANDGSPPQSYDKVALVSKVHSSSPFIGSVVQNMCLVKAAYNWDRKYPWIIFSTLPWKKKALERAQKWAYPANFTVVVDSEPLHYVLGNMTAEERKQLEDRCECCHKTNCCKDSSKLHWDWWCHEAGAGHATLSYLWQAEFRATHLWSHPALADYKYMIWIDNDALPTKPWPRDPIKTMVENDLVVMYDNYPQGNCGNSLLIEKMKMAYNGKAVCKIELTKDGHFNSIPCKPDQTKLTRFGLIHGMFHITNLDVYREPVNLEMNRLLTQHKGYKFSRQWDDQIAVTVVPAVVAPERAWDMRRNGFNMSMAHNGNLDGKEKNTRWSYTIWWKYFNHTWPLASRMCSDVITFAG